MGPNVSIERTYAADRACHGGDRRAEDAVLKPLIVVVTGDHGFVADGEGGDERNADERCSCGLLS
jgi:hypothetical protein